MSVDAFFLLILAMSAVLVGVGSVRLVRAFRSSSFAPLEK